MEYTLEVRKGTLQDVDELEKLYYDVTDYLDRHTNYPGWKKGIYPDRDTAAEGIGEDSLFIVCADSRIVGTVILRHHQEEAYRLADWHRDLEDHDVLVIHTLAVHPEYLHKGIGRYLIDFIVSYAQQMKVKAVRLDVYEENTPAMGLYESCGFQYIDTVDLGLGEYGLKWFKLYQRLL